MGVNKLIKDPTYELDNNNNNNNPTYGIPWGF